MLLHVSMDSEFEARAYPKYDAATEYKHCVAWISSKSLLFHGLFRHHNNSVRTTHGLPLSLFQTRTDFVRQ